MNRALIIFLMLAVTVMSPLSAATQSARETLIRNATILTAANGTLENSDILIQNGKIAKIGKNLKAGANAVFVDATGKFVTPGIIDCHSHSMLDAINEGSLSVTSMTGVRDALNPKDITIYRALASGVTAANLLHGSANSIGGKNVVVKFKWGHPVEDYPIQDAPAGIKFALGENPKRTHGTVQAGQTPRYPRTRMGVMETIRDAFLRARDYKRSWDDFKAGKTKIEPRRDLELEPLVEVIEGKRLVHAHGYRSDEHLNLLKIADEFGFRVATLQHGLEAYKIAPEIAKRGTGVSIFTDYWSYKFEAYDTIPYNAYILWKAGVVVSINSDDDERMRRLNIDAAKVMRYGGVPEQDALRMITLNPAKQLGIDKRTGSIEVGKDADLVIWNGHPFSVYSRPEMTFIEGDVYFDRAKDIAQRTVLEKERQELEKLDVNKPANGGGTTPNRVPSERRISDRDDADQEGLTGDNK
ncbi:MAG TPA: amidohydrolase family protein [Pyrinomonadaceae bacterium]|nr:amidohydrolase family protein [Pyrinomonadaceae bacterium]